MHYKEAVEDLRKAEEEMTLTMYFIWICFNEVLQKWLLTKADIHCCLSRDVLC